MVFRGEENCGKDFDDPFGRGSVGSMGLWRMLVGIATGEDCASEVSDTGYNDGEVVPTFPEAVVRGLVAEDLVRGSAIGFRWG